MFKKIIISLSLSLALSACVHIPESLRVEEGTTLTNFSQAKNSNVETLGKLARWGGVIAKVENTEDSTVLEVVHFELKSSTRPQQKDQTQGRFKVYFKGFLDPVVYKEGRSITAIGKISEKEAGKIGEHKYEYPVLQADNVHLWTEIKEVDVRVTHQPMWYTPSLWYHPRPHYYPRVYVPINNTQSKKTSTKSK